MSTDDYTPDTNFIRRHYSHGPTAYREDGSVARMPTPDDVTFCEAQFDRWLAEHDRQTAEDRRVTAEKAWDDGHDEPKECCGMCPIKKCPWDDGRKGPVNPYRKVADDA